MLSSYLHSQYFHIYVTSYAWLLGVPGMFAQHYYVVATRKRRRQHARIYVWLVWSTIAGTCLDALFNQVRLLHIPSEVSDPCKNCKILNFWSNVLTWCVYTGIHHAYRHLAAGITTRKLLEQPCARMHVNEAVSEYGSVFLYVYILYIYIYTYMRVCMYVYMSACTSRAYVTRHTQRSSALAGCCHYTSVYVCACICRACACAYINSYIHDIYT